MHALVDARRGALRPSSARCPTRCPGPAPGRQALRVNPPSTPGRADHGASGPCRPVCGGGAGRGRTTPCTARGSPASTSPTVVATVLRRLPLRRLARSPVRDVALRADHGGGPEPRPGPSDPARSRRRKTPVQPSPGRPGPPGSAWTRPTDPWRTSWEHLLVNPGPRTGHPTMPAAPTGRQAPVSRTGGPPRRRGPRGNHHHTKRHTPPAEITGKYAGEVRQGVQEGQGADAGAGVRASLLEQG